MINRISLLLLLSLLSLNSVVLGADKEKQISKFKNQQLTDTYYSEGISSGDIDGDGKTDVIYGPHWYKGPEFKESHEIYPAKAQDRNRYANNFFSWVYDFDRDGANDVFTVGFPGTPAHVYQNPGKGKLKGHWKKHQVFDWVSNESPWFAQIVGDDRPELVCTRDGKFGYATIDWSAPFKAWTFHEVSPAVASKRFGHGLGIGDLNSDGRVDIIQYKGWYEQPETLNDKHWKFHPVAFTDSYGGAEMRVYDVDGDGDNDVITSLAAHDFGLAWFENQTSKGKRTFKQHLIMGYRKSHNRYGLVFSEPHSVNLVDIDGDGLKDIITGKTYYSHHRQSPMWDAGAVVYWFKLVRTKNGVDWVPYLINKDSGIGRQVRVADLNADGIPDVLTGGMKGANINLQSQKKVTLQEWYDTVPDVYSGNDGSFDRGPASPIDPKTGKVPNALEGEELEVLKVTANKPTAQNMKGFKTDRWSNGKQLFWKPTEQGAELELGFNVETAGEYDLFAVFCMAKDFGIYQLTLNGKTIKETFDLFNYPHVITSGQIKLGKFKLNPGQQKLSIKLVGVNPAASKNSVFGLDYIQLKPSGECGHNHSDH